jgi:hypothetical protein
LWWATALREQLGKDAFDAAWAEGQKMTADKEHPLDEAVAYALQTE